jgi:hypothetical protein
VQRTHSRPTTSTAAEWPRPALISTIASDASASIRRGVRESSRVSFRACVVRHSAHAWCVCARARAEGGGVRRRNGSAGICGARLSASARQPPRTTSHEWAGRADGVRQRNCRPRQAILVYPTLTSCFTSSASEL